MEVVKVEDFKKAPRFINVMRLLAQLNLEHEVTETEIKIPLRNFKWEPKELVEKGGLNA